ncbi:DNA repair protein RadC [Roseobacter sp.]|uniref:RadC family protein n=1 Tax=Roseobacter sp. TaxID=1907202 RepID=UPI0032969B00
MASNDNGFSEEAMRGLDDLDRRIPAWAETRALKPGEFASRGGGPSPHYVGHRGRLRDRFLTGGHAAMPEYELLELLLFNAIDRIDTKPLAKKLLETFGDLNGVVAASEHRLLQVRGTTKKVFLQLRLVEAFAHRMAQAKVLERCALSGWDDLIVYCRTTMAHRDTEQFRILFLDNRNTVIADEEQARGTVNHVPVYPREVVKRALELNASALILVHNHPSGDPSPSDSDILMTDNIVVACGAIDVRVHDHVIIGKKEETSFKTLGLL